jgi:hypothetical protein
MFWHRTKILLIGVCMLGLVLLNILTLVNDNIHTTLYTGLKAILASSVADATMSRLLSNSPSQKYSVLEITHKVIETEHAELKRVAEKRAGVVKMISSRISKRTVSNAFNNALDAPAEAVPVLGAAAMLALTASDIIDDCQTLKDLNDLNISFEQEQEDETAVCGLKVPSLMYGN